MVHKLCNAIVFVLFIVLITGCSVRPSQQACEADDLLLEISSFPGDLWDETGSRDLRGAPSRLGIERAGTSFSTQSQGGAVQHYYHFSTEIEAKRNYVALRSDWFNMISVDGMWVFPEEFSQIELRADEHRLGCMQDVIETCGFVALYRTYVVEFSADMLSLTYENFVSLFEQIDQKMMGCIGH